QLKSYTVTASSSYGGTISGAGTYVYGTTVTMTATPYTHYNFVNWTEDGQLISEDASFSFVITSNRNFYATFAIETFDVTVTVNPANSGVVTGAGTYDYNTYATLTATPAEHYNFVNWTDAQTGQVYGTAAVLSLLVTQDYDIVANFILETLTVNITVQPANGGTVTGAGDYYYGTTATLTAEPNAALNFAFKGWYENNVLLSSALEYSFIVMQNHNIVAKFIRPGDVTDDGLVDIRDVTATVAYIMEQNPPVFDFDNGDLNGDGAIDMRDLMAIINIIFSKKVAVCEETAGNAVYTIENGVLYLETPVEIGAFMLKFDSEVTVSETLDGFDVAAEYVADGDFMVIAYSMSGKTLKPGKYALMTVEKAQVTGYSIATPEACGVNLIDGSILGIGDETVTVNVYPNPTDGMITVEAENMSEIVISNMMGQIVGRYADINASSANIDMNGYEKGTYLVRIITDSSVIVKNVVKI
ncbi:MAG: T9SS type A sorting domain-containing protein, partial [Bacteroidales bacterium]|nr:T9SS type A sorting domain-containing protein [Bacteroidales bacterium]